MHVDQLDVPLDLARTLVHEQFPHLRDQPIRRVPSAGTVNAIVRMARAGQRTLERILAE